MKQVDYRAARGSLAGTNFHELWALSQSMKLLDPSSGISAVAVEGLGQDIKTSGDVTEFDGVDCTLLYGSADITAADRVEVIQLKYSGSRPAEKWTLSKLMKSSKKQGNNSVLRRLATAYTGICKIAKVAPVVRLISNQAVSHDVVKGFEGLGKSSSSLSQFSKKVRKATSLEIKDLKAFAKSLDLISSTGSRFQLEQDLLLEISRWTDDDARATLEVLLSFIRKQMLPENSKRLMIRENVLLMIAGSSSPDSLFPCPNDIVAPKTPVLRAAAKALAAELTGGTKQVCLHGGAGCGKTTVVQQVHRFLPENSKMVTFDSYGGGRYLDAARLRHRDADAFVQLCNEIAVVMSLPLFLTRPERADARSFLRRLKVAAETLRGTHPKALLVVAVDAADNSLTAAKQFGERSFVEDLVSIEELPANVRILVSCRSERLPDLNLSTSFKLLPLTGFTLDETAEYVRATIPTAPQDWIDDFHLLSGGVPRVQRYAIDNGMHLPEGPLFLLRPSGKTLNAIFEAVFLDALRKFGIPDEFGAFCAALITLPRPIPIDYCATMSTFSRAVVADLCADLAPGLRIEADSIAFADEDIEEFIRQKSAPKFDQMENRAADILWADRERNDYSASHVATILFASGRKTQLMELIETEGEPSAIIDPIRRREVRLSRIKLGVKLANDRKDIPAALRALLSGAEAVKTDDAISSLINSNLDLAAAFAEESATRRVLLDKRRIALHGSLIAELMLQSAVKHQPTLVRSYSRQFRAWLDRRELEASSKQNRDEFHRDKRWDISASDVAATVEARFLIEGSQAGLHSLLRWRPRVIALRAAEIFVPRLLARGRADLVTPLLADDSIPNLFKAWLAIPLARAGHSIGADTFRQILEDRRLPRLLDVGKMNFGYQNRYQYEFVDKFLCACELSVKHWANQPFFNAVLDRLAAQSRRTTRLYEHDTELLNVLVRAYCLSCSIQGHQPDVSDFLGRKDEKDSNASEHDRNREESLRETISRLIPFFSVRAKAFLCGDGSETSFKDVRDAISRIRSDEYRIPVHGRSQLFELLALNIFDLCGLSGADTPAVLQMALSVFGDKVYPTGHSLLSLFRRASTNSKTQTAVLKWASERDEAITALQTTASEKSDAFIALARLTTPVSKSDGEVLFTHAHEATEGIDADARFQLKAMAALLERAVPFLSGVERKRLACASASIVTSAAIRIGNADGFPWQEVVRTIATAHAGTAFAAIAQWEDRSLAEATETLKAALEVLQVPDFSAAELQIAMNPLLESKRLLRSAATTIVGHPLSVELLNDLCHDVLQFGTDKDKLDVSRLLESIKEPNAWLARLRKAAELLRSFGNEENSDNKWRNHDSGESLFNLPTSTFTSAEEILEVIKKAKEQKTFRPVSSVLIAIGKTVNPANWVSHLAALLALCEFNVSGDDITEALEVAHRDWQSPAVNSWIAEAVPRILRYHLPAFAGAVVWDGQHATVDRLLRLPRETDGLVRALIEGLGRDLDAFDAGTIYELCRRAFAMVAPGDAASVLIPYVDRLRSSVPPDDKAGFDEADIPDSPEGTLARYLFVLMSDVDTRIRWRAAHCLRRLIRYGECSLIPIITGLWSRQSEKTFRAPDTPFYWQAARLWLAVSLSRIAEENPKCIASEASFLIAAIRDEAFPHPAVRSFCQDALRSMQQTRAISLSDSDQQVLESVNRTNLPRIKRDWNARSTRARGSSAKRWNFNALDTIPYWIDPTSHIFANLSSDDLAREAERWIVDEWKVNPSFSKWNDEPRQNRFSDRDYRLRSNDHGNMPTIEDYRTYLEWYSLQCAVGSLMKTEELSTTEYEGGDDEFEERLARQKLTEPPYWLADLVSTRPSEARLLKKPISIDQWLAEIDEGDFLDEISRADSGDDLIIFGRADGKSSEFSWDAHVESALVEPVNAPALVRALQTADEPLDFKLPEAGQDDYGDKHSFFETGFILEGWVRSHGSDGRFDEVDPLCFDVSRTRFWPFEHCEKPTVADDGMLVWPQTQGITFSYERWQDRREPTDRDYEGPEVRTSGSRLFAKADEIFSFLKARNRDLIMEIRISRKRGGLRYQPRKEEKSIGLEGRFCGIFLLRADRRIYSAEGGVGT